MLWIFIPRIYKNDYYTKKERLSYQLPKFSEVLFQQLCFLGGFLTCGVSPLIFGLGFFIVHLPLVFFIRHKFAFFTTTSSLIEGVVFAYLHFSGLMGFLIALCTHIFFYIFSHYMLTRTQFLGLIPFY